MLKLLTFCSVICFSLTAIAADGDEAECTSTGCDTCATCAKPIWTCLPRCTTRAVEVTEWGVQEELICPPRCGCSLFGLCRGDCGSNCETECDEACDGGCQSPSTGLFGSKPRVRKKLMRKTLVYNVPATEFLPHLVENQCSECAAGSAEGSALSAMTDRHTNRVSLSHFLERFTSRRQPATDQATTVFWLADPSESDASRQEFPETTAAMIADANVDDADELTRPQTAKIFWIDNQHVEPVQASSTMTEDPRVLLPTPFLRIEAVELNPPKQD